MKSRTDRGGRAKIYLICLFLVVVTAAAGFFIYLKIMQGQETFFAGTTVNGYEADGMLPEEVCRMLLEKYHAAVVEIDEGGRTEERGSLADFGYEIDEEKLMRLLGKAKETQRSSISSLIAGLFRGSAFVLQVPFNVDGETLAAKASRESLETQRTVSEDAYLDFDGESREYRIVPEVYGNDFPDESLKDLVQQGIDAFTTEKQAGSIVKIDIPEEIYYPPSVFSTDAGLKEQCSVYNQFCRSEVNYQFGSQVQTLGWDTIRDWIRISGGQGIIDEEKVREYVVSLESTYNTRYMPRHFLSSLGTYVEFPDYMNEYGYLINEDGEVSRLLEDISGNASVTREPVYYSLTDEYENPVYYRREGTDDLAGTYVEVNLTQQHLWFYKNGFLVVESDVVSGCVAKGTETQQGVFPLAYKESPSVLTGGNAENGYSTPVQYWMPFYEGQGLHDASWRGAFGGSIYISSGSHGCVNLPPSVAAAIYSEIEPGMAIVIYH